MNVLYVAGFGCRRGCSEATLRTLMAAALQEYGLDYRQLSGLATIDHKGEEEGLIALAQTLGLPLSLLSATQLAAFESRLRHRSEKVLEKTGIAGIAEAAALAHAEALLADTQPQSDQRAELIIEKRKNADATFALARVFLTPEQATSSQVFR